MGKKSQGQTLELENIKILDLKKKPIVEGTINGIKCYFLVDTGSDITIFHSKDAKRYNFKLLEKSRTKHRARNMSSFIVDLKRVHHVSLKLDKRELQTSYFAADLSDLISSVRQYSKYRLSGILGSDILIKYRINIDYYKKEIEIRHLIQEKPLIENISYTPKKGGKAIN